jgi:hypothetical protein
MRNAAEASSSFGNRAASTQSGLWLFAYEDGGRAYLPRVRDDADRRDMLTENVWLEKRRLITDVYGYGSRQLGSKDTPREEGFWCFDSAQAAAKRTASREQQS